MFRSRDAYLSSWKLSVDPIALNDLPAYAFDSPEERSRIASLLDGYNRQHRMTAQMDSEFEKLASERARRQPFRSYILIPIERTAAMWFTPRTAIPPTQRNFGRGAMAGMKVRQASRSPLDSLF